MKNLLLLFLVASFFASCASDTTEIVVLGENSSSIQSMESLESNYESLNPDIDLVFKPNTFEDAFNKANQDFSNKTGLYDIILQYNFSLSSFVRNNYVFTLNELNQMAEDVDTSFEGDLFQNVWKDVGYYYSDPKNPSNNSIEPIAYPFAANTMLLVYNKTMFNDPAQREAYLERYGVELEVPKDLESFYRVAEFFTQPEKGLKGVALQGATGGWLYYEWCSFLQGFGGKVMDKTQGWQGNATTPVLLTTPEAINAANYYVSLKPFNAGNFTTTDGVEQRNIIKEGNVAMGIIWSDYMWGLIRQDDGSFDDRFGFAPTPGDKSMIAGGSFYINKQSKNPVAAYKYVQYLMKPDNQIKMIKNGLCSPLRTAYDAPEVQEVPYISALKISLDRAEYMLEAGPDADVISNAITTAIQKIWSGELSADEGLTQAKEEIERERQAIFQ